MQLIVFASGEVHVYVVIVVVVCSGSWVMLAVWCGGGGGKLLMALIWALWRDLILIRSSHPLEWLVARRLENYSKLQGAHSYHISYCIKYFSKHASFCSSSTSGTLNGLVSSHTHCHAFHSTGYYNRSSGASANEMSALTPGSQPQQKTKKVHKRNV